MPRAAIMVMATRYCKEGSGGRDHSISVHYSKVAGSVRRTVHGRLIFAKQPPKLMKTRAVSNVFFRFRRADYKVTASWKPVSSACTPMPHKVHYRERQWSTRFSSRWKIRGASERAGLQF